MSAGNSASENPKPRFRLLDDEEIEQLPPPEWLIENVLPVGGLGVLFGDSGSGKTFLALDWAFSISLGRSWQGRRVKQGAVVYIAAEGGSGYRARVIVWKRENNHIGSAGVKFVTESVQFLEKGDVEALISVIQPVGPVLVAVDTLARCMVGGDEDRAKDMGLFIAAADRIRRQVGCACLIVHHPTKEGGWERGSGSLRGAIDTLMRLKKSKNELTLACEKQRDAAPFENIVLTLRPVSVDEETGSCVIGPAVEEADAIDVLELRYRKKALTALVQAGTELTLGAWRRVMNADLQNGVSERDFQRVANDLLTAEYVDQPQGRKGPYVPADKGIAACTDDGAREAKGTANCQLTANQPPGRVPSELPPKPPPL